MAINNKAIVILGPTASGKSEAAIKLARKIGGEVISADSRQVYKHMNLGTGKVSGRVRFFARNKRSRKKNLTYMSGSVPHHMIDIVSPKTEYNAAKFKKAVDKIILDIWSRGRIPIICGGTGFWIKAIVDNVQFPPVAPDWKLRQKLNKKTAFQLFRELKRLDPERAKNIDRHNKSRLIRAIEICKKIGKVPKLQDSKKPDSPGSLCHQKISPEFLQIGLKIPKEKLYEKIERRLQARFKQGMINEVRKLHQKYGVSWKRLEGFGLEYRWIALYLQKKISCQEMEKKLLQGIKNYARRQMSWFKKDKRIRWFSRLSDIESAVKKYLKKNNPS